ncbi:phosphatase domain-containing protein [Candidatus Puniceispirillum sp.]|uniref:phosphatase domain-containing protein n=1 Tax=Candidatus Puniceispirillum sp. TaxID=2026719 RepID=UPI003F69B859
MFGLNVRAECSRIYQEGKHIDTAFWNQLDIAALTASDSYDPDRHDPDRHDPDSHDKAGSNMGAVLLASCPGLRADGKTDGKAHDADIKHDVEQLASAGAGLVLTLLEADDRVRLGVSALDRIISDAGLAHASFPIRDHGIPNEAHSVTLGQLLDDLETRIRNGQSIAIHCQAGLGRTGMMAGLLLGRFGIEAAAAITAIRQTRPGSIETQAQEDFVREWGKAYNSPN